MTLAMAANLAAFLGRPDTTLAWGTIAGVLTGFGWVLPGIGVVVLFERRPFAYILVNGGYWGVALTVLGAILGGWRWSGPRDSIAHRLPSTLERATRENPR